MSYASEHRRMDPVLQQARIWDIANNPASEAVFEAGTGGFQIWCTPEDRPKGWDGIPMDSGTFSKPCEFVAGIYWGWEDETETITHLCLETDAYALANHKDVMSAKERRALIHNRPADITWAKQKIRWLFKQAGVPCPPIKANAREA